MSDVINYRDPIANKPAPTTQETVNDSVAGKKAYLKKLNYDSSDVYGHSGFNNNQSTYIKEQPEQNFDLWVTEVNYGYAMKGINSTSKYYKKYYPQAFAHLPIVVRGTTINEKEYNYLASFIREHQVDLATDYNNLLLLDIPAAGVNAIGLIESFIGGVKSNGQGIPVAPEFEFSFTVISDRTDDKDSHDDGRSFSTVNLYTSTNDNVVLITDENFQLEVMYQNPQPSGSITPSKAPNKTSNKSKVGSKNKVKQGTKNTRGRGR